MVGDAQANLDFYVGTLGLRLVKRTVNHGDVLRALGGNVTEGVGHEVTDDEFAWLDDLLADRLGE